MNYNLKNLMDPTKLLSNKSSIKKIFFYRICGTGMGACACLLKEQGFDVEGADSAFYPPMSDYLKQTGIKLFSLEEVNASFLKGYDLIVVGNSVPGKSEQARMIEECGTPFCSFPSVLGSLVLREREVVGIAGTHGKTTTTYFLSQLMRNLGHDCGHLIGGIMKDDPPARLGNSPYFVIESDEYDSAYFEKIAKFRLYELDHMLLTSLEFDHADIYADLEAIKDEFRVTLKELKGVVVANDDYKAIDELEQEFSTAQFLRYGIRSEFGPYEVETRQQGTCFKLRWEGIEHQFQTNIVGEHNTLNLSACLLFLLKTGHRAQELQKAVRQLELPKRRQEVRGHYKNSLVIDDFAHHPKAVDLTLRSIRKAYPDKKLITVFEPISATARSSIFQKEFAQSLALSDEIILAQNALSTTVKNTQNLDAKLLVHELESRGRQAFLCTHLDDLRVRIDQRAGENSVLLILSNRTCLGLWESDFVAEIV